MLSICKVGHRNAMLSELLWFRFRFWFGLWFPPMAEKKQDHTRPKNGISLLLRMVVRLAIERKQLHLRREETGRLALRRAEHFKDAQVRQMSFKWKQIDRQTTKAECLKGAAIKEPARIKRSGPCKVQEMKPNCRLAVGQESETEKMAQTMALTIRTTAVKGTTGWTEGQGLRPLLRWQ